MPSNVSDNDIDHCSISENIIGSGFGCGVSVAMTTTVTVAMAPAVPVSVVTTVTSIGNDMAQDSCNVDINIQSRKELNKPLHLYFDLSKQDEQKCNNYLLNIFP
ncbi:hypothetical protein M0813_20832 [Anaeramoeba flamelloides]|uniref:Uncharacterized protein n=1 Tax=Anaeramoeba flamelloides TaxID=1746091 RepID=A0ABQ8YJH3_9EUKA|nr:hypothetical protein M0813_20832 [Anaeramoeba flamelloides]